MDARAESYDADKYPAGSVVTFDIVSAGTETERQLVKNLKVPTNLTIGQVSGWDGVSKIGGLSGNREISDDTVILYIDSQAGTAQEGNIGLIREASDVNGDNTKENNVYYIPVGSSDLALLVVDINNNMKNIVGEYNGAMANATDLTNALAAGWSSITVGADLGGATATVGDGQTVKVTADQTVALNLTVQEGGTADISAALNLGTLTADKINITLQPGATLVTDNVTLFGDYMDVTSGTVVVKNKATGHLDVTVNGTVTINKDIAIGASDSITLAAGSRVVGAAAGVTLDLRPTVTASGTDNFYASAGNATTAGTLKDSSTHSVGNETYVWTTVYTDNAGHTAYAWLAQ